MSYPAGNANQKGDTINSILSLNPRFMRSVHLERDIKDPSSSAGYILTPVGNQTIRRIASGFQRNSTMRAWRVAGDYGSGKTDLALALARIASSRLAELPQSLHGFIPKDRLQSVVVTGDMEPLALTVMRAFGKTVATKPSTEDVLAVVSTAVTEARKKGNVGILLVIDELGKNLEYAARHLDADDTFLLQRLAEVAARSGDKPLVVVALLHQGFGAYASALDSASKREWSKVAGRFEEIIFAHPLEQTAALLAASLKVRTGLLPEGARMEAKSAMRKALQIGLYTAAGSESCVEIAGSLFPLHPTVLPLLVRTMRRLGQNERSLFSFISSSEPKGLQEHCAGKIETAGFFRLHHLYDYVVQNLSPATSLGSSTTHWGVIESVLNSTQIGGAAEEQVLKTVALFNLLDSPDLAATEEAITLAVGGWCSANKAEVSAAVRSLKARAVLYERGSVKGFCLWPHTSVDLDEAFADAMQVTRTSENGAPDVRALCRHVKLDHLVPREHYVRFGTLRYADVQLLPFTDLESTLSKQPRLDGTGADLFVRIVVPTDKKQREQAITMLRGAAEGLNEGLIMAVAEPQMLAIAALSDLMAWKWVQAHTPQLAGDRFAREEVVRQIYAAERSLHDRLGSLTSLASGGGEALVFFTRDGEEKILPGLPLLKFLGAQCNDIYDQAPIILNELINRRSPSSAAVGARTKLVEAMGANPNKPCLGMDDQKRPAEMALYLSILQFGKFHVQHEDLGGWGFRLPSKREDNAACRLLPALNKITATLKAAGVDALVPIPVIFEALSLPPFGIHAGLLPFVLAIYLSTFHQRVALYEDETYIHQIGGDDLLRLMKEPKAFHIQYCALEGVRADVFPRLLELLEFSPRDTTQQDLIDMVRPLSVFIAQEVPDYARRTNNLSAAAVTVRKALLDAREPVRLIFTTLPQACGLLPIQDGNAKGSADPKEFAARLSQALHEIRNSYPNLITRLGKAIAAAFDGKDAPEFSRAMIKGRASQLSLAVTEPALRAFAVRLADKQLNDTQWVESVANLLSKKSPERWSDADEAEFHHQLELSAGRFRRVEAALFRGATHKLNGHACQISLTKTDGTEVNDMIRWDDISDERLRPIQDELGVIISKHGRDGLAAAMKVLWERLNVPSEGNPQQ